MYNSTYISSNYGKSVLLLNSTVNTINISDKFPDNGTYINFINYSGVQYNIITDGPRSNYLNNVSLLKTFYTTINNLKWIAPSYYIAPPLEEMIINISTTPLSYTMSLPFNGFNTINVNWGNNLFSTYRNNTIIEYQYPVPTQPTYYSIRISGYATSFGNTSGYTGNTLISSVTQWGTIGISSLQGAFRGASNLVAVPSTISEYFTNMSSMFIAATSFNQDISSWDTSRIITMASMFRSATSFNKNLSSWNVSNVKSMNSMFFGATSFDGDIAGWNVSSVTDMSDIFYNATSFKQNISSWNTSNVRFMNGMFFNVSLFNENISLWNVSSVTTMLEMFNGAASFQRNISPWNTSSVTTMVRMFSGATSFRQNLSGWNVSNVTDATDIFCNCPGMLPPSENSLKPPIIPTPIWCSN